MIRTTALCKREIVVVDDGSYPPLVQSRPNIRWVRNESPLGVSGARMCAAKIATGDVLVWLDAHMTFHVGWLECMLAHVDSGALLCPAAWTYDLKRCTGWGANLEWCAERNYATQRVPGFTFRRRTRCPPSEVEDVPAAIGACYVMSRRSLEKLGGISPLLSTWGYDDIDLSIRSWITGLGVKCVRGARVGHLYRTAFPYPVHFDDLEFNQNTMLRSIFEEPTIHAMMKHLDPIPATVRDRIDLYADEIRHWREEVQSKRMISDKQFFRSCHPSMIDYLGIDTDQVGPDQARP